MAELPIFDSTKTMMIRRSPHFHRGIFSAFESVLYALRGKIVACEMFQKCDRHKEQDMASKISVLRQS